MKYRVMMALALVAVVAAGVVIATQLRVDAKDPSKKPIDFTLTSTDGKAVKLSDYRGKVVVVDVWATWCGYCVREIPDLTAIQAKATKDKTKLQFIGISVDDDKGAVKDFVKQHEMSYPVVYAEKKAMQPFGDVYGLPTKFIVNQQGVIVDKIIGATDRADLEKRIAKYLPKDDGKKK